MRFRGASGKVPMTRRFAAEEPFFAMDPTLLIVLAIAVAVIAVGLFLRSRGDDRVVRLAESAEKLAQGQAALAGQLQATQTGVNERLEALARRLGDGLQHQTEKTGETLKTLHERLAVIDAAQRNITGLSEQMVRLQDILSNKQARGSFGEVQLQDLVTEILPPSVYAFQATLGNRSRVDCLLKLPNPPGSIAIDAKFPLESYNALRAAGDDASRVQAARAFSQDVGKHVKDIAEKYIVPGETAESALMFLPSEAVYAELHANFRNVIEDSFRRRVWIVSPTTLMATLNTVRAVLKDVRMREQADVIQAEVMKMLEDVRRLDARVGNLKTHFRQAADDIKDIGTSAEKIVNRSERIKDIQVGDETRAALPPLTPSRIDD